jgi:hypothetical protein
MDFDIFFAGNSIYKTMRLFLVLLLLILLIIYGYHAAEFANPITGGLERKIIYVSSQPELTTPVKQIVKRFPSDMVKSGTNLLTPADTHIHVIPFKLPHNDVLHAIAKHNPTDDYWRDLTQSKITIFSDLESLHDILEQVI